MNNIGSGYRDIRYLDTLAAGSGPLHRLDPRAKLITTLIFTIAVVSFDKYTILALFPFVLYPVAMISAGNLPAGYFLRKIVLVSPFAVLVGVFNPLLDREILFHVGALGISGGWISFASILFKFFLTVMSALILIALTGFNAMCQALRKLGVPKPFVVQLLFFFRYIFVLMDEGDRMERARSLRSTNGKSMPLKVFVSLVGHLLLRSLDRAERIYLAMRCRGFDGNIRLMQGSSWTRKDMGFVAAWALAFLLFRTVNIPAALGNLGMEFFG